MLKDDLRVLEGACALAHELFDAACQLAIGQPVQTERAPLPLGNQDFHQLRHRWWQRAQQRRHTVIFVLGLTPREQRDAGDRSDEARG